MKDGWLGWAVFLGVSWTWCIGMFLPVILIRDYGYWAWMVFAVPNVVGAAAMGWVVSAERSRLMVRTHRGAMAAFSAVTVAFQIFFGAWVFPIQGGSYQWYLLGMVLIALAAMLRRSSRVLAITILFASVACAAGMFRNGEAGMPRNLSSPPSAAVAWLAPVCLFGFLLCPYLDATFHRARQRVSDRNAKLAFGVGFGVVFLAAIVLSAFYAKPVEIAMRSNTGALLILRWVRVYWMMQLGFTVGVHLIGDDSRNEAKHGWPIGAIALAGSLIAAMALALGKVLALPGETIYRGLLGFYGLAFPGYVWIGILPGRGLVVPTRRAMIVLAIAIGIALPMFYMAFIGQRLAWGVPGVVVVLLSRTLVPKRERERLRDRA